MSLVFRAEPSSTATFAGNATKCIPVSFYDHIGQTWPRGFKGHVALRDWKDMWHCQPGMLPECLSVLCGIHLVASLLIWRLPSDSASFENISHTRIRGSALTLSAAADTFSSFEAVFDWKGWHLSSPCRWNKTDHAIFWWWHGKMLWTLRRLSNLCECSVCRLRVLDVRKRGNDYSAC